MDDLLREFLTETNDSLDTIDVELVRFEQEPNNAKILDNIFRLVHTIKGTCGFLGLPRLEVLAHAAETLMGKFRDGMPVTGEAVSLVLATIDRIKDILAELERSEREPDGTDVDLIQALEHMAAHGAAQAECDADKSGPRPGAAVPRGHGRTPLASETSLQEPGRPLHDPGQPANSPPSGPAPAHTAERAKEKQTRGDAKLAAQSIRVNIDTLENLMTMVSELVLTRNQLLDLVRRHEDSEFKVPLQRLSSVTAELQEGVMKTRMQPIGNAWQKLPRIVRDLAAELGKDIELEMHGADTELDRQVLERIKDPLAHMVRNAADHGLETPAERRAAGKPEKGTIRLSAYHEGGHIVIGISDNGRGLDTARIRAKALAAGLISEAELDKLPTARIHEFIFMPGFSTAEAVTSISGRGVGMDVVRNNIDQIGGSIEVKSVPGEGTSFTIKIPLTLAIISALIVQVAGQRFAIPQLAVEELVRVHANSEHRIEHIKDSAVLRLRNKLLPLVHLRTLLKLDDAAATPEKGYIVVMRVGAHPFGIVVDGVFHTEEIVVKPLASKLRHIGMFSGNTILGDGSVIMIIDPNGAAQALGTALNATETVRCNVEAGAQAADPENETTPLLLFRAGTPELKAVPLSLVTRLEEIDCRSIEVSNGRHMVQYRGQLMPLVRASEEVRIKQGEGTQPLLVFSDSVHSMGLVVDEIVDIVEDRLNIEVTSDRPGVLGSAVIKGRATEIIDVAHFLPLAFEDWFRNPGVRRAPATRSLLFVDDSAFFRNMLTPVLRAAGFNVTAVAHAAEALALLRSERHFDVLVTDLEMPEMDGFALAAAVRADPRHRDMPIIALSAYGSTELIERGRQVGFSDFVAKFDRHGLIAALKEQAAEFNQAA